MVKTWTRRALVGVIAKNSSIFMVMLFFLCSFAPPAGGSDLLPWKIDPYQNPHQPSPLFTLSAESGAGGSDELAKLLRRIQQFFQGKPAKPRGKQVELRRNAVTKPKHRSKIIVPPRDTSYAGSVGSKDVESASQLARRESRLSLFDSTGNPLPKSGNHWDDSHPELVDEIDEILVETVTLTPLNDAVSKESMKQSIINILDRKPRFQSSVDADGILHFTYDQSTGTISGQLDIMVAARRTILLAGGSGGAYLMGSDPETRAKIKGALLQLIEQENADSAGTGDKLLFRKEDLVYLQQEERVAL